MPNDHSDSLHTDLSQLKLQPVQQEESPQQQQASQVLLLRECIYAVQGMSDGTNIIFYRPNINDSVHEIFNDTTSSLSLESVLYCPPKDASNFSVDKDDGADDETKTDAAVSSSASRSLPRPSQSLRPFPPPSNDMMMICGTLGIYVRYLQQFVYQQQQQDNATSAILRAFRIAVQTELQSYLQRIANFAIPTMMPVSSIVVSPQQQQISSIQELIYHIYPYLLRFKLLVMVVSSCCAEDGKATESSFSSTAGVHLLSFLHRHLQQRYVDTSSSDPNQLPPLVTTLFKSAVQPWLVMLYRWIMDGIISSHEFFITTIHHPHSTGSVTPSRNDDCYLWQYKYTIQKHRIPQIGLFHIPKCNRNMSSNSKNLVELIFIIGKGVNYIRQCLHDSSWSLLSELTRNEDIHQESDEGSTLGATATSSSSMEQMGFTYESIVAEQQQQNGTMTKSKLRTTLERSALLVHRHILSYLHRQFHLLQHLTVLKQFMLFGQGDFYTSFIDCIYAEYPSKQHRTSGMIGIYRHTLSNLFETSIKTTNAVHLFPTHVLDRLDIDLLLDKDNDANYMFAPPKKTTMFAPPKNTNTNKGSNTNHNQRTIWDTLVLTYKIPDPMVAILHDDAMEMYQSIFVHLLRINHIDYRLHSTWREGSFIYRSLLKNAQYLAIPVNSNTDYQQALQLLRTISLSRQAMMHFISSLKGYIMSEVVECGWKRLIAKINSARTLDEVISAHDVYLQNIMRQGLCSIDGLSKSIVGRLGQIIDHIGSLLLQVQDFCKLQEELFDDTIQAIERAEKKRQNAEQLAKQGSWGFHREREATEQETCFGLSDKTKTIDFDCSSEQFHVHMTSLVQKLDAILNGSRNNLCVNNGTKTPTKSVNVTEYASVDAIEKEEHLDFDALRFLASQLNYNAFYGVTNF